MLTLEQRAAAIMAVIDLKKYLTPKACHAEIVKGLRMLAEDCAKIADKYEQSEKAESDKFRRKREPIPQATHAIMSVVCGRIGKEIRALAAPKEEEGKEIER